MRYTNYTMFLSGFIALLSVVLLFGLHFDARWLGGEGAVTVVPGVYEGSEERVKFLQGDVVSTLPDADVFLNYASPKRIVFGETFVWLDERTEVRILASHERALELQVLQGRVVVDGSATLFTRDIETHIDGVASYVHYSWLNEIDVAGIKGSLIVHIEDSVIDLSNQAAKLSTLPPYTQVDLDFDPENSTAAGFYLEALR